MACNDTNINNDIATPPLREHSQALDLLRFPLALVVLTVHVFGQQGVDIAGEIYNFTDKPLFRVVSGFISSFLSEYSLAVYFFISGYVFFLCINNFNSSVYKRKLRNRVKTLLIPYVVWNIVAVLVELICFIPPISLLRSRLNIADVDFSFSAILQTFWNSDYGVLKNIYPPVDDGAHVFFPQDAPLWFLRALMMLALLTPVIYYLIRKFRGYFVVFSYLLWVSATLWGSGIKIELATGLFSFSFGAYMSISGKDMLSTFGRFFKLSVVLYLLLSTSQFIDLLNGWEKAYVVTKLLTAPVALVLAYNISSWLLRRGVCKVVPFLATASFFIYVSHFIFVGYVVKLVVYLFRPEGQVGTLLVPIVSIVVLIAFLLALFYLMQRFTPRLLKFITGRK